MSGSFWPLPCFHLTNVSINFNKRKAQKMHHLIVNSKPSFGCICLVWPYSFDLLSIFWKSEYIFVVWNRSKSKLCKFYIIDKFVKNICKYLSETDHLLEYWNCIHNNARAAAREIFNFATIIKHLLENA